MPNPEMLKFNIDSFIPDAILLIRSCQTQKNIIWKRGAGKPSFVRVRFCGMAFSSFRQLFDDQYGVDARSASL